MIKMIVNSRVRLSNISPELRDELCKEFTLENPKYVAAKKAGRWTKGISREIELWKYNKYKGRLDLPKGAAAEIRQIAKSYYSVKVTDRRLSLAPLDLKFQGKLRPYQQKAVSEIAQREFGVLEAGTGAGKTVMGLAMIAERQQPTIILVHTKELLYQWKDRVEQFLGYNPGLIGDGKFDVQPITVGIVNTVKKHIDSVIQRFGHVVVDECHRVPSTLFTDVLRRFPAKYMLGLSATPFRRDGLGKLIGWYCGTNRVKVDMKHLQNIGAVLRPEIIKRQTDFCYRYTDDYTEMVSALVEDQARNELIANDLDAHQVTHGGLSLLVADRVEHLNRIAALTMTEHCILTGKLSSRKRQEIVEEIRKGKVKIIFATTSLIGEGFDCPDMDALFLASPIRYIGKLTQVVGRVLRPAEDKKPMVYDYIDIRVGLLLNQSKSRERVYAQLTQHPS